LCSDSKCEGRQAGRSEDQEREKVEVGEMEREGIINVK
jgi:hypothetical protein